MSRRLDIPELLRRNQALASDPNASAWVSANAGSGKTHVLTQRVLRLMLDGAKPAQILGLTFTKAAAANMAGRIFATLAEWTSLDDEALTARIVETGAARPGPPALAFARQLFARAIETPGGLKIQTLHAFCERLLQLFPFEANVPAHFQVVDEREAAALMIEARNDAIAALEAGPEGKAALDLVAREAGVFGFGKLLEESLDFAETFRAYRRRRGLRRGAARPTRPRRERNGRWRRGRDAGRRHRAQAPIGVGAGARRRQGQGQAARGRASCGGRPHGTVGKGPGAAWRLLHQGRRRRSPRRGEGSSHLQRLRDKLPELEGDLKREQPRLEGLREKRRAAQTLERSVALFAVAVTILKAFAAAKAGRGALDFTDQIARALALVTQSSAAWVMQKLDYGLDHLLIDEAQDNSAEQWRIVEALTEEFFAGESARPRNRTVFAVGDEKQSIFSFQGAAPELFGEMRRNFERRCREAQKPFERVPLNFSFRSAPAILAAVDMTFATEAARTGLLDEGEPPPLHEAIRKTLKGVVEIWPTVEAEKPADPDDWRMPLDEPAAHAPPVILAGRIAEQIARWTAPGSRERVVDAKADAPRPIRAGDVMILVRRRNAFFEAMIRALKMRGVKVAGADRLKLRDHIAVMDLIAAGHAALTRDDDLTLACVLKSPLIGLDENALYALAADRRASLAAALAASEEPQAQAARRRLEVWRDRAERLGPYAFYARLVGEDGGRKALIARLGNDAAEPIDEFLALALGPRAERSAVADPLPRRGRGGRSGDQARPRGGKRRRAGADRPREQGPRGADRVPARYGRRAGRPARPQAHASFAAAPGRAAVVRVEPQDGGGLRCGRRGARGAATGRSGRAPEAALCRDDPCGGAPRRRRIRDPEAPSRGLLVRSRRRRLEGFGVRGAGVLGRARGRPALWRGARRRRRREARRRLRPCPCRAG